MAQYQVRMVLVYEGIVEGSDVVSAVRDSCRDPGCGWPVLAAWNELTAFEVDEDGEPVSGGDSIRSAPGHVYSLPGGVE